MNKTLSMISVLAILLFAVSVAFAEVSFDGIYEQVEDAGSIAIYAQDGNTVYVTGHYVIGGQPRIWYGKGQRDGNTISYTYKITVGPSRLAAENKHTGKHVLTISSDGKTMTGKATASDGTSAAVTMKRK